MIRQLIRVSIPRAQHMGDRDAVGKRGIKRAGFALERLKMRRIDFISAFHLARHQLAVGMHRDLQRAAVFRLGQSSDKRLVLRDIVCGDSDWLADFDHDFALGSGQQHSYSGCARVAFGCAVDKEVKMLRLVLRHNPNIFGADPAESS